MRTSKAASNPQSLQDAFEAKPRPSLGTRKLRITNVLEEQLVKLKHDRISSPPAMESPRERVLAISGINYGTGTDGITELDLVESDGQFSSKSFTLRTF